MKHHRLIILLFFAAFLFIGGYLLLSAQGLFFDWQTFRIIKTGGAFISYSPKDAQLKINGKIQETSSFFLNSGNLIKKLKPGTYELVLIKEGFNDWNKKFEIKPGLVTEFKKITLIEKETEKETVTFAAVKNFWLTAKGPVYQNVKNQLYFGDFRLTGETVGAADPRSPLLIIKAGGEFFLTDLNKPKTVINLTRLFNSLKQRQLGLPGEVVVQKIFFHPLSKNKIVAATSLAVYEIDLKQVEIKKLLEAAPEEIIGVGPKAIFLKGRGGSLRLYDLVLQKETTKETGLEKIEMLKASAEKETFGLIDSQNRFYSYDSGKEKIEELFPGRKFKDFFFSPDGLYLTLVSAENDVLTLNLRNGSSAIIDDSPDPNKKIAWLDSLNHYLLVQKNGSLLIQDVFGLPPFNKYPVLEKISQYETSGRTVYALTTDEVLFRIEF